MSEIINVNENDRNEEGRIVSVELAPGFARLAERAAQAKAAASDEGDGMPEFDIFEVAQILTDAQIERAIMAQKPGKDDNIARFFLQELFRRDEQHAMEVFRRWRNRGE